MKIFTMLIKYPRHLAWLLFYELLS